MTVPVPDAVKEAAPAPEPIAAVPEPEPVPAPPSYPKLSTVGFDARFPNQNQVIPRRFEHDLPFLFLFS